MIPAIAKPKPIQDEPKTPIGLLTFPAIFHNRLFKLPMFEIKTMKKMVDKMNRLIAIEEEAIRNQTVSTNYNSKIQYLFI